MTTITLRGAPAGGDVFSVKINGRVFEHVARKGEAALDMVRSVIEQANSAHGVHANAPSIGPLDNYRGLQIVGAYGDDRAGRPAVSAMATGDLIVEIA